ncbi:hypothetical protein BpHYR1_012270 [Brachionus plicatilis]|uniref:Uncharacterized protein n=1 Tax=Brachionus plicatilis TaxID=10195 RepID=A0A3M7S9T3_BRAPC|nr:hypothetical protein BpHYR1_012270 [Brachionus plicatilis]
MTCAFSSCLSNYVSAGYELFKDEKNLFSIFLFDYFVLYSGYIEERGRDTFLFSQEDQSYRASLIWLVRKISNKILTIDYQH